MRRQVDHYLARGRAAGALDVLGNRTKVSAVLERSGARARAHARRARHRDRARLSADNLYFRGERQDLEEMAGNLIDNACKWARAQCGSARVRSQARSGSSWSRTTGRGWRREDRERVLERGERLDESVPGSGLGLSIVEDIAKLYGGTFELGNSALGGLGATLILPAIA